jgi:protein-tyrosine phosphatase
MSARVIDLHTHILPGIDDGARTIEDSRELALRSAAEGITTIAATPHVRSDYPTTAEQMEAAVSTLRADFSERGIGVELIHGGEIDLDTLGSLTEDQLRRFSIAQTGRYVLLESPYHGWPLDLQRRLFDLALRGFTPILAHPERNAEIQGNPRRLAPHVERGLVVQLTAASLEGRIGRKSKEAATQLVEAGLAHMIASDAHTPDVRESGLAAAAGSLKDPGLATFMTEDVPAAVVNGEPIPDRPRGRRRRLLRR